MLYVLKTNFNKCNYLHIKTILYVFVLCFIGEIMNFKTLNSEKYGKTNWGSYLLGGIMLIGCGSDPQSIVLTPTKNWEDRQFANIKLPTDNTVSYALTEIDYSPSLKQVELTNKDNTGSSGLTPIFLTFEIENPTKLGPKNNTTECSFKITDFGAYDRTIACGYQTNPFGGTPKPWTCSDFIPVTLHISPPCFFVK